MESLQAAVRIVSHVALLTSWSDARVMCEDICGRFSPRKGYIYIPSGSESGRMHTVALPCTDGQPAPSLVATQL